MVVGYIEVEVQEQVQVQVYTVVVQVQGQELGTVVELAQDMVEEQVQVFATKRSEYMIICNYSFLYCYLQEHCTQYKIH